VRRLLRRYYKLQVTDRFIIASCRRIIRETMSSNNEMTLMLKCGLLVGDQQVGDFKFISWFYGQQKPYIRQQSKGVITQTLKERLVTIFPDIVEPFQVVFIGIYTIQLLGYLFCLNHFVLCILLKCSCIF
jgi:hypothetical protein